MSNADRIRKHGRDRYVLAARNRGAKRFSIRVGDVVSELGLVARAPAVCSALKTSKFLNENNLRVVDTRAPKSGQSTTVVYTYEFNETKLAPDGGQDNSWVRLRGSMKDIFTDLGGGETYLREERNNFYALEDEK